MGVSLARSSPRCSPSAEEHGCGVYFYPYVLDLFRTRQITFRGALLIAAVDYHINSWRNERMRSMFPAFAPVSGKGKVETEVVATTGRIRELLQCDDSKTVRSTIEKLKSINPPVFRAVHIKRGTWKMKTQANQGFASPDGIYVNPTILDLWRSGRLEGNNGWGMLLLAKVDAFERNGKKCFVTNRTIGKWCGVGVMAAEAMVRHLKKMDVLDAVYVKRGRRTRRFLSVVDGKPKLFLINDEGDLEFSDEDVSFRRCSLL